MSEEIQHGCWLESEIEAIRDEEQARELAELIAEEKEKKHHEKTN